MTGNRGQAVAAWTLHYEANTNAAVKRIADMREQGIPEDRRGRVARGLSRPHVTRAPLRPLGRPFRRLHCNQHLPGDDAFVSAAAWDACSGPIDIPAGSSVVAAVDAGIRGDSTAVVTVRKDDDGVCHAGFALIAPLSPTHLPPAQRT